MLSMRPPAMLGLFSAAVALTAVVAATLLFALPADAAITNTTFTLEIKDITKTSATLGASRSDGGRVVRAMARGGHHNLDSGSVRGGR